jgi:hypothetical protein
VYFVIQVPTFRSNPLLSSSIIWKLSVLKNGERKFLRSIGSYAWHLTASHLRIASVVLSTSSSDKKIAAIALTRPISAQLTSPRPFSIYPNFNTGTLFYLTIPSVLQSDCFAWRQTAQRSPLFQFCHESDGFGGLVVSMLASGSRVRGFDPDRIVSMPSFGGEVK